MKHAGLVLALLIVAARPAYPHDRSFSYSTWRLTEDGATAQVRVTLLDLSRLGFVMQDQMGSGGPVAAYLAEHLQLFAQEQRCEPSGLPIANSAPEGWVAFQWQIVCPATRTRAITTDLLFAVAPAHLHFARATLPDGKVIEKVLTATEPWWPVQEDFGGRTSTAASGTSLLGYLRLGVQHILSGWDHLAFVVALLLLAGTVREVATLVTAFTIAHSFTLGLAMLRIVHPEPATVEAMIGFSIALVATENAWLLAGRTHVIPNAVAAGLLLLAAFGALGIGALAPLSLVGLMLFSRCHFGLLERAAQPARLRAAVAFAFGLVHGFGFAGVLTELELPEGRLAPALFGFNLGVEVGQLAIVALVWPLLRLISRLESGRWERLITEAGSAAICALGIFWFLTRTLG